MYIIQKTKKGYNFFLNYFIFLKILSNYSITQAIEKSNFMKKISNGFE